MLVGAAIALSVIGLVMIWSTTQAPHPGRRVLLRQAPGAVPRARHRRHGRGDRDRLPPPPRPLDARLRRDGRAAARGARAARLEHQGPPGMVPAAGWLHAPTVGAGQVRHHRGAGRLLQPVPRRARRVAHHHDPRARRGTDRARLPPARPRHRARARRDHRGAARGGRPHRSAAARARAARDHRRVRGREPRDPEGVPDRPVHVVRRSGQRERRRATRTTRSSRSRRSRTAGSAARASAKARRPRAASCPSSTPTSSSRRWGRSSASSARSCCSGSFAHRDVAHLANRQAVARLLRRARVRRRAVDARVPDVREHRA